MYIREKRILSGLFALMLLCVLAAGGLTGCEKQKQVKQNKKQNIELWHYWDISHNQQELERLLGGFNESQDKYEVTTRYVPDADFKKELALSMAEGDMPDLALVDSADFRFFHGMKPFVDITDEISGLDEYLDAAMEPCTINGRVRGLPVGLNCVALFYNKQMLSDAGVDVPVTWEEFYEAADKLTKDEVWGFGIPALQSEESMYTFLPLLWSMGGDVDSIDSLQSQKAFEMLRRMSQDGIMSRQSISLTLTDMAAQFAKGNVAMIFNTPMIVETLQEKYKELDFGVAYLPSDGEKVTVLGGEIFGVTEGGNTDGAIAFLKYISDKDRMAGYMDSLGYLAARGDVISGQFMDEQVRRQFVDIFETARAREFSESWPHISNVVTEAMEETIIGEKDEREILEKAALSIHKIREEGQ